MKRTGAMSGFSISIAMFAAAALGGSPTVHQCKTYVQGRLDVVHAEIRKGTQQNQARELLARRDRLKAQLVSCEKNPKAYKKDL
jgi:hypothetical protein